MNTWHIHIKGQVQGVGFRPFVYRLAKQYQLNGWVSNAVDGVHIEINASEKTAQDFLNNIQDDLPVLARITTHYIRKTDNNNFDSFSILESGEKGDANLLLTPDVALCKACQKELHDQQNRRSGYPFITCTNCGPRYSIINLLPYDRAMTTMKPFEMCSVCLKEYHDPNDRRYFSQTNSCQDCSIELGLWDKQNNLLAANLSDILERVNLLWQAGKIIAIKGIGGYLLTCDALNSKVIKRLRQLKHRPSKPFALMYPNEAAVEKDVLVIEEGLETLRSIVAPIVLFQLKNNANTEVAIAEIAPGLDQIGVMLPYTPLYELLLENFGNPIVATSGNISNSPIIFDDEKAQNEFPLIADFILANNREIVLPQDDSVIRFSPFKKQKIILRRSRGLAPTYINPKLEFTKEMIFAAGAKQKSTFTILHQGNIFISQYLGDLDHFDTTENYRHTIRHFCSLFNTSAEIVLMDKHPDYASSHFAEELAKEKQLPCYKTQHHVAHFSAILGEHNLIHSTEPVLGVIWDGTGLGDDDHIWGSAFFLYHNFRFERCTHLDYFDFILGEKMPREPRISALSLTWNIPEAVDILKKKFSPAEWSLYNKILAQPSSLKTSSMGRLFDAVASLLKICDRQSYEGQAATLLENKAFSYFKKNGLDFPSAYHLETNIQNTISTKEIIKQIVQDILEGQTPEFIAAKFHFSLVQYISAIAKNNNCRMIAFSGGVFQNGVLIDLIIHYLQKDFTLYFHKELSPNDENISFGQLINYQIQQYL